MQAYHNVVVAYLDKQMKEKRDQLKLTQEKMAARLKVSERMYGNYERGKCACRFVIFCRFAAMFSKEEWLAFHDVICKHFKYQEEEEEQQECLEEETARAQRKRWKCKE